MYIQTETLMFKVAVCHYIPTSYTCGRVISAFPSQAGCKADRLSAIGLPAGALCLSYFPLKIYASWDDTRMCTHRHLNLILFLLAAVCRLESDVG